MSRFASPKHFAISYLSPVCRSIQTGRGHPYSKTYNSDFSTRSFCEVRQFVKTVFLSWHNVFSLSDCPNFNGLMPELRRVRDGKPRTSLCLLGNPAMHPCTSLPSWSNGTTWLLACSQTSSAVSAYPIGLPIKRCSYVVGAYEEKNTIPIGCVGGWVLVGKRGFNSSYLRRPRNRD